MRRSCSIARPFRQPPLPQPWLTLRFPEPEQIYLQTDGTPAGPGSWELWVIPTADYVPGSTPESHPELWVNQSGTVLQDDPYFAVFGYEPAADESFIGRYSTAGRLSPWSAVVHL